jgi:neutral ceramidase
VPLRPAGDTGLVLARVGVTLPEVDPSRLTSGWLQPAAKNVLCTQTDGYLTLSLVRVGGLTLLSVPGEPSFAAGKVLEERAGADRLVSLAGGYLGYVEPAEVVQKNEGEARRQYYGPGLAAALEEGARTALEAVALVVNAGKK